jgi:indole-3-glycerol phosphate synthase
VTSGSAFLDRIIASKRDAMSAIPSEMKRATREAALAVVSARADMHSFLSALSRKDRVNIIAEVKRSSPSAGAIQQGANAVQTAQVYENAGAAAISVLTESEYFNGSLQDLTEVASRVQVPVLRKDFTVDSHQIYEAAIAGASAVLLILAALTSSELRDLRIIAEDELGLDALVEAHSPDEVEAALDSGATLIGINNRNLQTLEVSLDTSRTLSRYIVPGKVFISESGIKTPQDIDSLKACGYRAFLIGETLMRAADPAATLRSLAGGVVQ